MDLERLEELLRALHPAPSEWVSKAVETPDFVETTGAIDESGGSGGEEEDDGLEPLKGPDVYDPSEDGPGTAHADEADDDPDALDQ